jgi:F0F1-type ATP synthase epsilon subunit
MKGSEQEGGFLEINQSTARWLANGLLAATNIDATKVEISALLSEKDLKLTAPRAESE